MLGFDDYLMRHGEAGVLAVVEQIERNEGVGSRLEVPLEERWAAVMGDGRQQQDQDVLCDGRAAA